jgi:hypothetical protein
MKKIFLGVAIAIPAYLAGYWSAIYVVDDKIDEFREILILVNEKIGEHSYIRNAAVLDEQIGTLRFLAQADKTFSPSDAILHDYILQLELSIANIEGHLESMESNDFRTRLNEKVERSKERLERVKFESGIQ